MQNDINEQIIDQILQGYIECALWSSTDDNERPLDENYDIGDLSDEIKLEMRSDVADFYGSNMDDCDVARQFATYERIGHDFWLTRNRHGAGFWDGPYESKLGRRLTEASHPYGSAYLMVGDDGLLIYFCG